MFRIAKLTKVIVVKHSDVPDVEMVKKRGIQVLEGVNGSVAGSVVEVVREKMDEKKC